MSNETVVLQDSRLDPDRFILEGVDVSEGPSFTVSQLGKFFFARTPYWVRWLEEQHRNVDGDPNCPHHEKVTKSLTDVDKATNKEVTREVKTTESWIVDGVCSHCGGKQIGTTKTATGYRIYNLADIERLTHALLSSGAINGAQATNALHLVQTMSKIYGLIS